MFDIVFGRQLSFFVSLKGNLWNTPVICAVAQKRRVLRTNLEFNSVIAVMLMLNLMVLMIVISQEIV